MAALARREGCPKRFRRLCAGWVWFTAPAYRDFLSDWKTCKQQGPTFGATATLSPSLERSEGFCRSVNALVKEREAEPLPEQLDLSGSVRCQKVLRNHDQKLCHTGAGPVGIFHQLGDRLPQATPYAWPSLDLVVSSARVREGLVTIGSAPTKMRRHNGTNRPRTRYYIGVLYGLQNALPNVQRSSALKKSSSS